MSCQLPLLAVFQDIKNVKKLLFPNDTRDPNVAEPGLYVFENWTSYVAATDILDILDKLMILTTSTWAELAWHWTYMLTEVEGAEGSSWDEADWGWRDEEEEKGGQDTHKPEKDNALSWLQECCVSVSATADYIAIGHNKKMVILSRKNSFREREHEQRRVIQTACDSGHTKGLFVALFHNVFLHFSTQTSGQMFVITITDSCQRLWDLELFISIHFGGGVKIYFALFIVLLKVFCFFGIFERTLPQ